MSCPIRTEYFFADFYFSKTLLALKHHSGASMLLRILSATVQSFASKPRLAPLPFFVSFMFKPICLAIAKPLSIEVVTTISVSELISSLLTPDKHPANVTCERAP